MNTIEVTAPVEQYLVKLNAVTCTATQKLVVYHLINKVIMNKYILSIAILLLLKLSCKKKEAPAYDPYSSYNGSVTVMRNGAVWNPKSRVVYDSASTERFYLSIVDARNFAWDGMTIGNIEAKAGTFNIDMDYWVWKKARKDSVVGLITAFYNGSFNEGSDIASANYMRLDRPHFIKIDQYDPATKRVSGTFSVSFIRDSSRSKMGIYLDTVSYTNATFSATIWNQDELPK
jgi:hypothetical protein